MPILSLDQALIFAIKNGKPVEEIKTLLQKGANIHSEDDRGNTALDVAAYFGRLEIVKLLLTKGALVRPNNLFLCLPNHQGNTPLHHAAAQGHLEILKTLIEHNRRTGYNYINTKNKADLTPISIAARNGQEVIVRYLLKKGAQFQQTKLYQNSPYLYNTLNTPLMLAAQGGHLSTVQLLLEYKANIDDKNQHGQTALHLAAEAQQKDVVFELLRQGADLHALDNQGHPPLLLIQDQEWLKKILLELKLAEEASNEMITLQRNATDPFPYEYARMSEQAYETDRNKRKAPEGWTELKEASSINIDNFTHGYYAIAWINHTTHNIVISHRGTDFYNEGNLEADRIIFERKSIPAILNCAQKFTDQVLLLRNTQYSHYHISHTGHSLGSVIAEVEAARTGVTAMGFDSIGSRNLFALLNLNPDNSNITIFFSSPNHLNTANPHVGRQFRLFHSNESHLHPQDDFDSSFSHCNTWLDLLKLFANGSATYNSHKISKICNAFDKTSKMPIKVGRILQWPCGSVSLDVQSLEFHYKMDWQDPHLPEEDEFTRNVIKEDGNIRAYKKEQYTLFYPHCPGIEFKIKNQPALEHVYKERKPTHAQNLGKSMTKALQPPPAKKQKISPILYSTLQQRSQAPRPKR